MSTTEKIVETGRRRRRRHTSSFKAEAVGACQQPGVSIAAVALARGLNANLLRTWLRQAERRNAPIAIRATEPSVAIDSGEGFLPAAALQSDRGRDPRRSAAQRAKSERAVASIRGA